VNSHWRRPIRSLHLHIILGALCVVWCGWSMRVIEWVVEPHSKPVVKLWKWLQQRCDVGIIASARSVAACNYVVVNLSAQFMSPAMNFNLRFSSSIAPCSQQTADRAKPGKRQSDGMTAAPHWAQSISELQCSTHCVVCTWYWLYPTAMIMTIRTQQGMRTSDDA